MSEPTPSAWPSYSVTPHQADGGCPVSGLVILGLGGALAGLALGVLAGIISQWFYLVLLFPICIGLGVGVAGRFAVKAGKVRNSLLCGVAGFLAGCFAVLAMHYYGYFMFEKELAVIPPGVRKIAANFDQLQAKRAELPEEVQKLLDELSADQQFREALAVDGFLSHVDMMARRGVEISKRGRNGLNLGYVGSYIYWGIEMLIIAVIACCGTLTAVSEPFCSECEMWKTGTMVGGFTGGPTEVKAALESGDLTTLSNCGPAHAGDLLLTLFRCPSCQSAGSVEARLEKISVNEKGETSKTELCTTTYPGEANATLESLFPPSSSEPDAPSGSSS